MGNLFSKKPIEIIVKGDNLDKINGAQLFLIIERHALSCANLVMKGMYKKTLLNKIKAQYVINKNIPDPNISLPGVIQCLQVADFLKKNDIFVPGYNINNLTGERRQKKMSRGNQNIVTIFACSELIRTQETLFVSFNDYMKDSLGNGKIIVIPWLNEVTTGIVDLDNIPASSLNKLKEKWKTFISSLNNNQKLEKDLGGEYSIYNPNVDNKNWDDIFYLSPLIYKLGLGGEYPDNAFAKNGKTKNFDFSNVSELLEILPAILAEYLKDTGVTPNVINLVMASHHHSSEKLIKTVAPSFQKSFQKNQLMNCEVIKLPAAVINNGKIIVSNLNNLDDTQTTNSRLFPMGFYKYLKIKKMSIQVKPSITYNFLPYYVMNFSDVLFLPAYFITSQKYDVETQDQPKGIEIPLNVILSSPVSAYLGWLGEMIEPANDGGPLERLKLYYQGSATFNNYSQLFTVAGKLYNKLKDVQNLSTYTAIQKILPKDQPMESLFFYFCGIDGDVQKQIIEARVIPKPGPNSQRKNKTSSGVSV